MSRKNRIQIWLFAIIGCLMVYVSQISAREDFVEEIDKRGGINWTTGSLKALGYAEAEKKIDGQFVDGEKAFMAAKQIAHNNLLKMAKSVRINGNSSVGEFAVKDEEVMVKLMEIIKNINVAGQLFYTNGTVEVFMDMSFYGGFSQLVLPKEIEQVETIRSFKNNEDRTFEDNHTTTEKGRKDRKKEIYSGLVVDARGLGVKPVLSPRIIEENSQEIYGPAFISRDIAVQKGICIYESDISAAKANERVLANPLVVKAIRTKDAVGAKLVISNTDALKIKSNSQHLAFLRQCRVIIVIDLQKPGNS